MQEQPTVYIITTIDRTIIDRSLPVYLPIVTVCAAQHLLDAEAMLKQLGEESYQEALALHKSGAIGMPIYHERCRGGRVVSYIVFDSRDGNWLQEGILEVTPVHTVLPSWAKPQDKKEA